MKRVIWLKIEIAEYKRMSETGSSLIRLIQNNETPILDLLVREAVQNSLDAALSGSGHVQVDFSIRQFNRATLSQHFEGISERMDEVCPNEEYKLLEIRDSNTYGLIGPLHEGDCNSEDFGNLIKLIYQIGMPQQKEGAGGSWGLGKTVYFRVGIGIVVYYSRILESGKYVSRLAACLVEDEKKGDALLKNKGDHRGIAWWGQDAGKESTMPLTNEEEISNILACLGTAPYEGDKTGTTVIIPFLRDDLRPSIDIIEGDAVIEDQPKNQLPWWDHTDSEYITVSLQRWYAPRLMNPGYNHGRWLRATMNGVGITKDMFLPIFSTIQELYNEAIRESSNEAKIKQEAGASDQIQCLPIKLQSTFTNSSIAGWVSFVKLSDEELKLVPPHNQPTPWSQIFGRDLKFETNPTLISFVRKPGMIVGYEYTGKWVDNLPRTSSKEFIVGLFVANSTNQLTEKNPKNTNNEYLLEEYIRGCEKADHTSWADWTPGKTKLTIIDRIQKNLINNINKSFSDKMARQTGRKDVLLGKLLADVLLPPEGFGSFSSVQPPMGKGSGGSSGETGKNARFINISHPVYENDLVRIDFELYGGKIRTIDVKLKVITESGAIDADYWEGDQGIGVRFPVKLYRLRIDGIHFSKTNHMSTAGKITIDHSVKEIVYKDYSFKMKESTRFGQPSSIHIENLSTSTGHTLSGSLWIVPEDKNIRAAFYVDALTGGSNS